MAAEFATSVALTIFDHSLGAIVRQVGYLWNHRKNLADLQTHVKKLDDVRNDKSHSVLVAQRNTERIRSQVKSWQNDAEKISLEATNIMELYEENAKKRCLIWLCPNVVSNYKLSRRACKKQSEIVEAMTEANQFNAVSDRAVRRAMSIMSTEGYLTFGSRKSILEKIMETMKDATKNMIGVYGLGGMGKTTLAKQVASRATEEKLFDEIVMASVTQSPELIEIQGEIAKKLDLKLEESSVAERAGRIHQRLKEKKVLLILDDLWKKLDLEKVGIPFGSEHLGCKLLFTSRFQSVLSSMGIKKNFHLGALEEEETWRLFEEKTTDVVKDLAFLDIGKKVAQRCAGLPVLIVTVAASLSSRPSLPAWKDALKELKKMNNKDVHEIVNSAMEFISYNHLEETHKRLFLLCGLLGSGISMSDYLKYSWGWNLFDEDVVTLEEARNKLYALILDLKASCLLLDGDDEDIIKIHDVVRGVAISLARKNQNMLCVGDGDTELIRWPSDDVLRSCTAMFFDDCRDFSLLPQRLECSLLEIFYIRRISLNASSTIPDTFFQKTRELKVLDMTQLCFSGLPSSLSCLESLQTLCLYFCTNLEDISIVGELKKLQVLCFMGSDIEELPRGIGQLSELRWLDLTDCSKLKIIPAGLLAGLFNLEELYMRNSFNKWEAEEFHSSNSERSNNVSLAELKHLPKLRSLEIEVEDAKLLSQDLNFERLERYRIIAGYMWAKEIDKKGISRKLVTTDINHLQNGVTGLVKRTECLCLREPKGIKDVIGELDRDGLPELKHLTIQSNDEIQFIVNVKLKQQRAFPALDSLHLNSLSKLEKICNGRMMQDSFGKLTSVEVRNCDKLESLFSFSMAIALPCLQELQVSNCRILKGIVGKKSDEDYNDAAKKSEKMEFVQLRSLLLEGLPQLMSFYYSVKEKQSEKIVSEEEEPSSSMSLFKEVNFPNLESLKIYNLDNIKSIWHNQANEEDSCCKLEAVEVASCAKLLNIFPSAMLNKIQSVKKVQISNCQALEKVFEDQKWTNLKEITYDVTTVLHQLRDLYLYKLPKLKSVFLACVAQRLHHLEKLYINDCMEVETIVEKDNDDDHENKEVSVSPPTFTLFPKLTELYLWKLPKVECFYPKKHASQWPRLNVIEVNDCDQFSIVDLLQFSGKQEDNQFQKLLSQLERLTIRSNDIKVMTSQHSQLLLVNLTWLTLTGFNGDVSAAAAAFPSKFLYALHNLVSLKIEKSSFGEIFRYEEGQEEIFTFPSLLLPHLTKLYLINLPELKYICTQNSPFFPILNQLEELYVIKCPRLTNLAPTGSVSFKFVAYLTVKDCGGLIYLIQPSTAASLEQLQMLTIIGCSMIEEIVAADDSQQDHHHIILFTNLRTLKLEDLPRLTNFCTANNYTFNFLKLTSVDVSECPNMRSFSPGITITPMLQTVSIEFRRHWKGDLNTTIQHHFSQMEAQRLTTTDPSTSSNNHVEPEAHIHEKPTESLGKEAEEIREEFTEPRNDGVGELGKKAEISENVMKPENEIEVCEEVAVEEGKVADSCEKGKGIEVETESRNSEENWNGDLNTSGQHLYSEMETPRLTAADPTTSEPQPQIHDNRTESAANEIQEISDESTSEPREEIRTCVDATKPSAKGKEKMQISGEDLNYQDQASSSNTSTIPFYDESSVPVEQQSEKSQETVPSSLIRPVNEPEEQTNVGSNSFLNEEQFQETKRLATTDPSNNHPEPEAKQIESAGKEVEEIEPRDEGQTCESGIEDLTEPGNEEAETCENVIKPEKEFDISEEAIDPRDGIEILDKCNEPRKGTKICEEVADPAGNEGETWNHPHLESNIVASNSQPVTEDFIPLLNKVTQILPEQQNEKFEKTTPPHSYPSHIPVNTHEEQTDVGSLAPQDAVDSSSQMSPASNRPETSPSLVTELGTSQAASNSQQNISQILHVTKEFSALFSESAANELEEICEEDVVESAGNEPEEQTNAGSLAPRGVIAFPSQVISPTSNHLETSLSRITEPGTSRRAASSDSHQIMRVTKEYITLLSEFLQIRQTQPLSSMSTEQIQFVVDAFRDLSKFSIELHRPYAEKARERLSIVERKRKISELELKIAETKAQLEALEENKKALEEENEAIASRMDLDD